MDEPNTYTIYFKADQQAKIGIKLADSKFLDVNGIVRFIGGDRLTLELIGTELAEEPLVEPGAEVYVTTWTGWSLCRCCALLTQKIYGRRIFLQLIGPVIEKQNREYFRLDVTIPLRYAIPERQLLAEVHVEWAAARGLLQNHASPLLRPQGDGFIVVRWNGQDDIMPQRINLSGGGLRFRTREYVAPETLVAFDLFLPLIPPRVIHTIAETLRCNEILLSREKGASYNTAVRFHFINEKDRETIIAFVFAEQRRILSERAGKRVFEEEA